MTTLTTAIKQWHERMNAASERGRQRSIKEKFFIKTTEAGFFIICEGVAVMHFDSKTTLEDVQKHLELLRETAIEYHTVTGD